MKKLVVVTIFAAVISVSMLLAAQLPSPVAPRAPENLPLNSIKLPPGFSISLYATGIPNARSMTRSPSGTLFVGSQTVFSGGRPSSVYAVVDRNNDYKADEVITIASGLNQPNGVAFRNGSLYVAEISRITRYDNIEANLKTPPKPVVVNDTFPSDFLHGWKFIAFGPDGLLYVPVGGPCNVCKRDDNPKYASITRMKPDGTGLEVFASGVRNTVGFDWHPVTRELWFTDNGRDNLGDNIPPDELNRAPQPGLNFGFPECHAGTIKDPELGANADCSKFAAPAITLTPHGAAIGMRFYTGTMFPQEYRNQIFIAEHGSWNRREPIGYRVSLARIENNNRAVKFEPFAEGWLQPGQPAWGRPADVLVLPDGSLLVSDDQNGVIYRISYRR